MCSLRPAERGHTDNDFLYPSCQAVARLKHANYESPQIFAPAVIANSPLLQSSDLNNRVHTSPAYKNLLWSRPPQERLLSIFILLRDRRHSNFP